MRIRWQRTGEVNGFCQISSDRHQRDTHCKLDTAKLALDIDADIVEKELGKKQVARARKRDMVGSKAPVLYKGGYCFRLGCP